MKIKLFVMLLIPILFMIPSAFSQTESLIGSLAEELEKSKELDDRIKLLVYTDAEWTAEIHDGDYITHTVEEVGSKVLLIPCGQTNLISITVNSMNEQYLDIYLVKTGMVLSYSENTSFFQEQSLDCSAIGEFQMEKKDLLDLNYLYVIIGPIIGITAVVLFVRKSRNIKYGGR
ncbi:hypothetical protein [Nitrosopumilus sp. S4]